MPNIKYRLSLTAEEHEELKAVVKKGRHSSHKVINALILLNCDEQAPTRRILKEQQIAVSGEISLNVYTTQDGVEKTSLELRVNSLDLVGGKKEPAQQQQQRELSQQEMYQTDAFQSTGDNVPF